MWSEANVMFAIGIVVAVLSDNTAGAVALIVLWGLLR